MEVGGWGLKKQGEADGQKGPADLPPGWQCGWRAPLPAARHPPPAHLPPLSAASSQAGKQAGAIQHRNVAQHDVAKALLCPTAQPSTAGCCCSWQQPRLTSAAPPAASSASACCSAIDSCTRRSASCRPRERHTQHADRHSEPHQAASLIQRISWGGCRRSVRLGTEVQSHQSHSHRRCCTAAAAGLTRRDSPASFSFASIEMRATARSDSARCRPSRSTASARSLCSVSETGPKGRQAGCHSVTAWRYADAAGMTPGGPAAYTHTHTHTGTRSNSMIRTWSSLLWRSVMRAKAACRRYLSLARAATASLERASSAL